MLQNCKIAAFNANAVGVECYEPSSCKNCKQKWFCSQKQI